MVLLSNVLSHVCWFISLLGKAHNTEPVLSGVPLIPCFCPFASFPPFRLFKRADLWAGRISRRESPGDIHLNAVAYVLLNNKKPNRAMQNNARSSLVFGGWFYAHGVSVFGGRV